MTRACSVTATAGRALTCALALVTAIAHANPEPATQRAAPSKPAQAPQDSAPDPAVQEAGDANLETTENRQGLTFAMALGGGFMAGFGIDGSVGRAGSASFRLGHVATRHTVITLELHATTVLHKPAATSATFTNTNIELLAGAQYYVNPSLWLRFGVGAGRYTGHKVQLANDMPGTDVVTDFALVGPAVLAGLGFDIARYKSAVLGFELGPTMMVNRDGVLLAGSGLLCVAFD